MADKQKSQVTKKEPASSSLKQQNKPPQKRKKLRLFSKINIHVPIAPQGGRSEWHCIKPKSYR
ncbi:hypothetical protein CXF74_11240 [Psychromonas sp. Urea-02u-13]|nr:hypothetical protein CXF74_11240 [Psychromonas sp. Urea-02u-13]